jgi:hypothetical protein
MTPQELRAMRRGERVQIPSGQSQMIGDGSPMTEQQMMMMEAAYNPMMQVGGSPDVRRVDRWLTTKIPREDDVHKFWFTETELAEELAMGNFTKEEYNWFIREYAEIEAIAGGDGNEMWVRSRQRKLFLKIKATRSRSDNKEVGLRDGTLLMTQNVSQKSDVKMPTENQNQVNAGGFFGLLRGH